MSYRIEEHHNPDEARYGYTPGGYDDPFSPNYIPGYADVPAGGGTSGVNVNGGSTGDALPPGWSSDGSYFYDGKGGIYERTILGKVGSRIQAPTTINVSSGGGTPVEDWGPLEYGTVVPGKITQTSSRGNVRVVGDNGAAAPSAGTVSYKEINGVTYAITLHPDGTITSQQVPGLPTEAGTTPGGTNKQSVVIGGQAYTFDPATGTYTKAEGIGTPAANPYDPSKGAQGRAGGSSGGDGGLTRQLASIASAAAKAEAEANRAFQREQLAAQQARDAAQIAIQNGQLDLARQQFAASERHAAEAERIRVTELRGTLASQAADQISGIDPLGYSTWLDLHGGGGQGPFTNALATGTNAVTTAAMTPAALTLQALAELNNPSGTQTGGTGQQTFNNPTGQSPVGSRFGGLSGIGGSQQRGRGNVQEPRDYSQPSTPVSNTGQFQVEDPNRPGVMLSLTRGQLNDLIYNTTHAAPNPQTGARINDTTSIGGPMFDNGQSSYVDNSGTFVSRTGAAGVQLDSTYTNGGETLTPAAQAALNNIDPATGLMKMAQGGLTNARQMMVGDAQHPDPFAGGARPEIIQNPTGAPISVIPSPQTQSMATGGLSGLTMPMGGPPRPMDAMQYRQQYRPRPAPVQMPRFAYGTSAPRAPRWNAGRPGSTPSGPSGPVTTMPTTPTPIPPSGSVPPPTTTTPAPGNTSTGIGGLTGITPQQSYLDQVAAYRANAQGPDVLPLLYDVGWEQFSPMYRDVGLMKVQGQKGIPVSESQFNQRKYALAGGPQYGGY
jgi:hypothetical protein